MTSIIKVDTIQDQSGNNIINENANTITIGKSGDTVNLASGATAGFGKVLQVVTATDDTQRQTTSTSFVTGSINVNITPSSTSSKVLILYSTAMDGADGQNSAVVTIYRDSTNLAGSNGMSQSYPRLSGVGINHLDSPSTTSEITYTIYFKLLSGSGTVDLNYNGTKGNLTAMEIAG
jgi:hypothetical protein